MFILFVFLFTIIDILVLLAFGSLITTECFIMNEYRKCLNTVRNGVEESTKGFIIGHNELVHKRLRKLGATEEEITEIIRKYN